MLLKYNASPVTSPVPAAPKGEPSKVIRLPVSIVPTVQALLATRDNPARVLSPHPDAPSLKLPKFSHKVRAGFPSPADDYVEAWLDPNGHLIEHREATFFVLDTGDSMTGIGIQEGSLLVVDRALEAKNNDIVIAVIDGELTVKSLEKRRGKIRLLAENPVYEPIEFKEEQSCFLCGLQSAFFIGNPVAHLASWRDQIVSCSAPHLFSVLVQSSCATLPVRVPRFGQSMKVSSSRVLSCQAA